MRTNIIVFVFWISMGDALAGGRCEDCLIQQIGCSDTYNNKQSCVITFDKDITSKPTCSQSTIENKMIINAETAGGKAMISGAYTALASSIKVTAYGTDYCALWNGLETVNILYLNKD